MPRSVPTILLCACLQVLPGCYDSRTANLPELALLGLYQVRYFAYFPAQSGSSLQIREFNPNDGTLSEISGSPFSVSSKGLVYPDPGGRFMYAALFVAAPDNVKGYSILRSGALTPTSSPLSSANNQPTYIGFTPDGSLLFTGNYASLDVSAFFIDRSTGNLTKVGDFATSCGCGNLAQLRVTPNGKYLYVAGNGGPNPITEYSINQTTGSLSLIGNVPAVASMDAILVDPTSTYLYAVSSNGTILGYSISPDTGALSALSGSPFSGAAGNYRAAMHPSGRYLYTVNIGGAQLARHDIASNGALSAPTTLSFGANLQYVTIDPTGRYGFVNDGSSANFYVFSIDQSNDNPTLISGNPFNAPSISGGIQVVAVPQYP